MRVGNLLFQLVHVTTCIFRAPTRKSLGQKSIMTMSLLMRLNWGKLFYISELIHFAPLMNWDAPAFPSYLANT